MKKIDICNNWKFTKGEISSFPFMRSESEIVNLPHDFMIKEDVSSDAKGGKNGGFYPGCTGTYEKELVFEQKDLKETMFVLFEGCYGKTKVLINGNQIFSHMNGYTPFLVNIRPYVKIGNNKLSVVVYNDDMPNARWYTGAGLYRGVSLLVGPSVYIENNGVFVYTDHILNGDAFIKAEITICNEQANHTGNSEILLYLECKKKGETEIAATRVFSTMISSGDKKVVRQSIKIEDADLWDVDTPNLYDIKVKIAVIQTNAMNMSYDNSVVSEVNFIDSERIRFGIRTISADSTNGLQINGKSIKLKGGCIHHDNGLLGACSYRDAEYRKVKLHKRNGYNALRLAHNPHSSYTLDACDELGIIVIDEAFDIWGISKNNYDFSNNFDDQWKTELQSFIRRDRNHPSVVFWSIGNEVLEQGGMGDGYSLSEKLSACVRENDETRLVCGALSSFFQGLNSDDTEKFWQVLMKEASEGGVHINMDNSFGKKIWPKYTGPLAQPWDVVGYNYLEYQYEPSHIEFPDRVICSTESMPGDFETYWRAVQEHSYLIGDFVWTSQDYIGEAGIGQVVYTTKEQAPQIARTINFPQYPWRLAGTGDFDLCGNLKPQGAYHKILWGSNDTYIFCRNPENNEKVEILGRYAWPEGGNHWSWLVDRGSKVLVEVYSKAEEVELLLNGNCIGRQAAGADNHYKACFEVEYEPGTLCAISYAGGKEVSRDMLVSTNKPENINITLDREEVLADGQSLVYGTVEIVDKNGLYVPTAPDVLGRAKVIGNATLVAFGNGRGATNENYTSGVFTSYEGRWQIILRTAEETGKAKITVETDDYGSAEAELYIK